MLKKILIYISLCLFAFSTVNAQDKSEQKPQDSIVRISFAGESFVGVEINDSGDILTVISYLDTSSNAPICVYKKVGDKVNFYKTYVKYRDINSGLSIVNISNSEPSSVPVLNRSLVKGENVKLFSLPERNALDLISLLGWGGISAELQSQIDALTAEQSPEADAKRTALLISEINTYIASLPKEAQFDIKDKAIFTISEGGVAIEDVRQAQSPLNSDVTISALLAKSFFLQGAPLFDSSGALTAMSFVALNDGVVYFNADEISKFLRANNVPFASTVVAVDTNSILFLTDYIIIASIVLFALVVLMLLILRARKSASSKKINFGSLPENASPKFGGQVSTVQDVPSVASTKIMTTYTSVFSRVKNTSVSEIVSKIKKLLSSNGSSSNINLYKIAKDYKDIQEEAEKRLSKCIALINKNSPDEALNMATSYPSLIDLINDLQFDELGQWIIHCRRAGVSVPDSFAQEDIDKLNDLFSNLKTQNIQDSMKLRKYVSLGKLKEAIELLECACSLNPDGKEQQNQLLTLKASFLDKEITRISNLAQAEKHAEALKAYEELCQLIPKVLRENSSRWSKMQSYARGLKLEEAKSLFEDTIRTLRADRVNNWKETFEIILVATECLENFPELEELSDSNLIENKKRLALDLKSKEIADRDFEDLCDSLIVFINGVKDIFKDGKNSKDVLQREILKAEKLWSKLKIETRQIPEDIHKAYDKCVKYLHSELRAITTRKVRFVFSGIILVLMVVGAVSFVQYNNMLKRDAYSDYERLLGERVASAVLEESLSRLDQKYSEYLGLSEFSQIRQDILNVCAQEKSFEDNCFEFISKTKRYGFSKLKFMKSLEVKAVENEIEIDYANLADKALEQTKEELSVAKKSFEVAVENYKDFMSYKIQEERGKLIDSLDFHKKSILRSYEAATPFDEEFKQFEVLFNKLKAIKDPYVAELTSAELAPYNEFIENANSMNSILAAKDNKLDSLDLARSYDDYMQSIQEAINYYADNNISDDLALKKLKTFYLKKDRILLSIENYFKEQSFMVKDLYSGKDAIEKTGKFLDLSQSANKDAFALDFSRSFPFWIRNIYEYNYESFNRSDVPILAKPFYTVSKAETLQTSRDDIENYRGFKILENLTVATECKPLNAIDLSANTEDKTSSFSIINLKYLTKEEVVMERLGEYLVNGKECSSTKFLGDIFMQVYDENMQDIMPNVAILEIVDDIVKQRGVDENFKIYLLGIFMNLIERYAPLESGLFYSPSLLSLKTALDSEKTKSLFAPLSWLESEDNFLETLNYLAKRFDTKNEAILKRFISSIKAVYPSVEVESLKYKKEADLRASFSQGIYYVEIYNGTARHLADFSQLHFNPNVVLVKLSKDKLLSPSRELRTQLENANKTKLSFLEEAKACFEAVLKFNEPDYVFLGYFDANSKFKKGDHRAPSGCVYFYFDNYGDLQVSKQMPDNALPYSPLLYILDTQAYLKEIVRLNVGENDYIFKKVYRHLFPSL